jgi:PAS domain S-box-containing protein
MFTSAPVALAIMDGDFRYESVNPAYCALTGYSSDELIGTVGSSHLASEAEHINAGIGSQIVAGKPWIRELRFCKKDGTVSEVEWQIVREDVSGVWILVATDVTQLHRAEEARQSMLASERAARTEAERSNRLKEEFLATLSHELRNPLNAILGWATVLARKSDLPEPVLQGLKAIVRNSRFQAQMISDLLDYAGITFGKIRTVLETIDPYPAIRAAIEMVKSAAEAAGVTIEARFAAESLAIEADATRFQQVVVNLLSNAVKFSDKGGQVLLEAGCDGEALCVVVSDQGRGIEPEFVPRIFERFSQEEASITRSRGGLGLGLAIVKQLAEMHGGSVTAASPGLGRGAVFTVRIPLSHNKVAAPPDAGKPTAAECAGLVALVVEDDADARALTKRILMDAGAEVVEASSAEEALARVAAAKPDILISDIGMPHQDGYQLLRRIRAGGYPAETLPAIALTAFARMEDRTEALAAGYQEHLIKPLDAPTLLSRVAALCGRSGGGSP